VRGRRSGSCAALVALCLSCGSNGYQQAQPPTTPGDIGNVNCSTKAGSAAGLTGFGATIGAWNATHERDPKYLSWGPVLGDGRRMYSTVRCSNDGLVIVVQEHIYPAVTATRALALARAELPSDVKLVYDFTQAQCRNLQYQSQTLASEMGAGNPDGIANIQLEVPLPSVGTDLTYDADNVGTIYIDLLDALGIKPDGC
jgi:hypothetical protein